MSDEQLPAPYEVGYRKPPAKHRFEKGKSGNPNGRPRGAKQKPNGQGLDFGTQPANQMLLEEAYRTVALREGDKTIELPVIRAVFRAMGVSAMKGNRLAQSTLAELVRGIEEEDRKLRMEYFAAACEYKWGWEQEIEHARRHNLPEPQPIPHPADVIIDVRKSEVRYAGPVTPEEKEAWDRMLEFRDEQQEWVTIQAGHYRNSADDDPQKQQRLDSWRQAQELYDRMNDRLPERYKERLVDRCYIKSADNGEGG